MTAALRFALLALLLACFSGCADPAEFATFEARGFEGLPDCFVEQFPLDLDFLAARKRTEQLGIFLQSAPDVKSRNDIVYFELFRPQEIGADEALELGTADVAPRRARGKLTFFSSCPFYRQALDLHGTVIFETFDPSHNGIIAGELLDGYAVDPRSGQIVIAELNGSWRFIVRSGPPYEDFYALPERPDPGDFR